MVLRSLYLGTSNCGSTNRRKPSFPVQPCADHSGTIVHNTCVISDGGHPHWRSLDFRPAYSEGNPRQAAAGQAFPHPIGDCDSSNSNITYDSEIVDGQIECTLVVGKGVLIRYGLCCRLWWPTHDVCTEHNSLYHRHSRGVVNAALCVGWSPSAPTIQYFQITPLLDQLLLWLRS